MKIEDYRGIANNHAIPNEMVRGALRNAADVLEQAQADIEVKTIQIRCLGEEWDSAKERITQLEAALKVIRDMTAPMCNLQNANNSAMQVLGSAGDSGNG